MGVASWSWLSGLLMGLGRLGAVLAEKGRLVVSRGFVARGCGWLSVVGIGNTPVAAWFGWWWVPLAWFVRVGVACCRGSGVVRPGCLACGSALLLFGGVGLWVWVGWL